VTPVAHYQPGRELVVGPHHLEVILGVEIGRELGRADQVAEERRELPPLVGAVRRLTYQVSLPARSDRRSTTVIL
jgi:hypothetical protein